MNLTVHICRPALLGLILVTSSSLLSADVERAGTETTAGWSIQGGQVELQPAGKPQVSGTFLVNSPQAATGPLAAPLQGGACLVADLVPFGIGRARCETNADCNGPDAIDKQHDTRLAEYVGYCATRDGSTEPPRCWTRPGPPNTHCRRSVDALRLIAGVHKLGPVDADPLGSGEPFPEWAVYACMAQVGHERACGEVVSPYRQVSLTPLPLRRE